MRILSLFLVMILVANMTMAKPFVQSEKLILTGAEGYQVPIDDEFRADFVQFDENEFKKYQKEQKKQVKSARKCAKLKQKKVKLELQRQNRLENQARCKMNLERLQSVQVPERSIE